MKYAPISFKSDYSLLKSLIKIKDIIECSREAGASYAGILDDNPYAIMDFYDKCEKANLKCVFGMVVKIGDRKMYFYIKNYEGYQNLIKINDYVQDGKLTIDVLFKHNAGLIAVLPYENYNLFNRLKPVFPVYLAYKHKNELNNALQITKNVVFLNEVMCLKKEDSNLLKVLYKIGNFQYEGSDNYVLEADSEDVRTIEEFVGNIDFSFELESKHIPRFTRSEEESWELLYKLSSKGLEKRLKGRVTSNYRERLENELKIIKEMGFVDYFLIVYDYIKYAKKNNIYVGPGRGSAAGALVSYTLGITDIDPLKYDLLFERFLNPERITMPDIDVDFEDTRRNDVIEYVRGKYGAKNVSLIIAYGTLGARAVLRDVAKVFEIDVGVIDKLCKLVDAKKSLKENLKNNDVLSYIRTNSLEKIYKISLRLEGLKKNTTIHAAGVVISSVPLISVIPTFKTADGIIAGYTMEYLEKMGLLKMDFLALRNLSVMHKSVDVIKEKKPDFDLRSIPLNDEATYKLLSRGDTDNIFQFDTPGMRNFIKKLRPENFDDLIAAIALFRPGPMENIDDYISRRKGVTSVTYLHPDLKPILSSTFGIIVYQEQIMQILSLMGGYSYAEADLIRRAMSKKKKEVMIEERERFVSKSQERGYSHEVAEAVYDLIVKFANYGFNKSHSVAYALIGYQMAYMKAKFTEAYHVNTLNMNIGSDAKVKDVIEDAKSKGMRIMKPDVNRSDYQYKIEDNTIILPLTAIKGISAMLSKTVVANKPYADYFDFFKKIYGKGANRLNIEALIKAGALDCFGVSRNTLLENMDSAITYLELVASLDESLVEKPDLVLSTVPDEEISELDVFGFFVSGHPVSKLVVEDVTKFKDAEMSLNKKVTVAVIIKKLKVVTSKKGDKMAFLDLEDDTRVLNGVIFPKSNFIIDAIDEEKINILRGIFQERDGKMQFIVDQVLKKVDID